MRTCKGKAARGQSEFAENWRSTQCLIDEGVVGGVGEKFVIGGEIAQG